MDQADQTLSMGRRALLTGGSVVLAFPNRRPDAPTTMTLPVPPAGKIWVCVPAAAWSDFVRLGRELNESEFFRRA